MAPPAPSQARLPIHLLHVYLLVPASRRTSTNSGEELVISVCVSQCLLEEKMAEVSSGGRAFQEDRTSGAKVIKHVCDWHVQETGKRTTS